MAINNKKGVGRPILMINFNEQHNIASAIGNATKTAALRYY
jgi:hypothetical protein